MFRWLFGPPKHVHNWNEVKAFSVKITDKEVGSILRTYAIGKECSECFERSYKHEWHSRNAFVDQQIFDWINFKEAVEDG